MRLAAVVLVLCLAGCGASPELRTLLDHERHVAEADAREWPALSDAQRAEAFRHLAQTVVQADEEINHGRPVTLTLGGGR